MRISDWSSDVCSSDLGPDLTVRVGERPGLRRLGSEVRVGSRVGAADGAVERKAVHLALERLGEDAGAVPVDLTDLQVGRTGVHGGDARVRDRRTQLRVRAVDGVRRSEEHTSELQSLMRTSYAVFCLTN